MLTVTLIAVSLPRFVYTTGTVTLIAVSLPGFVYITGTVTSIVFIFWSPILFSALTSFKHQLPVKSQVAFSSLSNYTKTDGKESVV